MFSQYLDELRDAFSNRKYDIMFNTIKKILPLARQKEPEHWFIGSSLFQYFPEVEKTDSIGNLKLYYGNLSLVNKENAEVSKTKTRTRNTLYIHKSPDGVSPWYYYSTGISNFGENFPDFFFILDEQSLISDFPYRSVFPKKASIDRIIDSKILWKKEIIEHIDDKEQITKLLRRFINIEDLLFSILFGYISNRFGLKNGWKNTEIISSSDYNTIIRYLANKKDIEKLAEAVNFKGFIGYNKNQQ